MSSSSKSSDSTKAASTFLRTCSACGTLSNQRLPTCTRCGAVYYCNRACQLKHWGVHKKECDGSEGIRTRRAQRTFAQNLIEKIGPLVVVCNRGARRVGFKGFVAVTVNTERPDYFDKACVEMVSWTAEKFVCRRSSAMQMFFRDRDLTEKFPFVAPVLVFQTRCDCNFARLMSGEVKADWITSAITIDPQASKEEIAVWKAAVKAKRGAEEKKRSKGAEKET